MTDQTTSSGHGLAQNQSVPSDKQRDQLVKDSIATNQ